MKLIKPYFEIIEQECTLPKKIDASILTNTSYLSDGIYKQIELAGRTCYKSSPLYRWYSEDNTRWINEDSEEWKFLDNPKKEYPIKGENISAKAFTERMIKSGHGAMLEHGTVYLHIPDNDINWNFYYSRYKRNKYSKCNHFKDMHGKPIMNLNITTNLRVLIENNWLDDLKYLCEPTKYHEKRVTVRFVCDRGVSHKEFVA